MRRLLITGAAGGLGGLCRDRCGHMAETLRVSDIADLGPARPGEEAVPCDLADADAVMDLVEGCDGILHFGGTPDERAWEPILRANIEGVRNLYAAARAHGRPRIFLASSNHVVGFHDAATRLDAGAELRPDTLYGASKVFAEAVARLHHDRFGQETARVRIGTCEPEPRDHRSLSTWLSHDDLVSLVECVFRAPRLGCPVIWGVSANDAAYWDNGAVSFLGWRPKDNAEAFREAIEARLPRPAPDDPTARWQGGAFAAGDLAE